MEVGKAHYSRRLDAISPKDPFYSVESWKDRIFNAPAASTHTWSEGSTTSVSSSSPSFSSGLPSDGGVDKVLFHNLVEMIPLVETFMEQKQGNRSFPRRASLVYTPNPQDVLKATEHGFKGKKGQGQLVRDIQVDQNARIAQLQDQMEQLEIKLHEKDGQLQAIEKSTRQAELTCLQATVEELQGQVLMKETEISRAINQLSDTQHEIADLHCLLEEAESDAKASNVKAAKAHEQSQGLQCQVAALLLWMESISSCLSDESIDEELDYLLTRAKSTTVNGQGGGKYMGEVLDADGISMELTMRKYQASIIAAKHNPTDELLVLVAELRGQLHSSLRLSDNDKWG